MLFFKMVVWEKAAESTGALKRARNRVNLLSKCLTEFTKDENDGMWTAEKPKHCKVWVRFPEQTPSSLQQDYPFYQLSLKVSTPNRDLRLLLPSNFTEIRSGIKKLKELSQCRSTAVFGEFGSQVVGKIKHFLWRAWQRGYLHSASLGRAVTAVQKINDILTSCLAQAEPVSPRRWRGPGAGGYPEPFTAAAAM